MNNPDNETSAGAFVPAAAQGEVCGVCGQPAQRKVEETIFDDDPRHVHPRTTYLCLEHFNALMTGGLRAELDATRGALREAGDGLHEAVRLVAAIVAQQGGEVRLSDAACTLDYTLSVTFDEVDGGCVVTSRVEEAE